MKYTKELPDTEEEDAEQEREALPDGVTVTDTVPPGAMEQNPDGTYNAYDADGKKAGTVTAEEYEAAGNFRE